MLEFFIMGALEKGPLQADMIEHRMRRISLMLEVAARRNGSSGPEPLDSALKQLVNAGWLEVSVLELEGGAEKLYSLTATGVKHLEAERKFKTANLAATIEDGALDDSFRKFLDRNG